MFTRARRAAGRALASAMAVLAALVCVAGTAAAADVARAAEPSPQAIQQAMGENFQIVTRILTELIAARYEGIGQDLDIVIAHADQLAAAPPADLLRNADDRDKFHAYATNLRTNANQLKAVAEELAKRDRTAIPTGVLSVDYLRVAASAHFGNMVTGCVLCHNQFRRRTL